MTKPKKPAQKRAGPKPRPPRKPPKPKADTSHLDGSALDASQPLDNPRHERFCQLMASHGMAAGPAYTLAGYVTTTDNARDAGASRTLRDGKVLGRFKFLQNRAAALAVDAAVLTKADIINMTIEQHQRNIGVRPAHVSVKVKTGRDKGKTVVEERLIYNEHAANQTLKLLHDEWGLGDGGSASRGEDSGGIDARATEKNPEIAQDLDNLRKARSLVLAGGTDITGGKAAATQAAQLKKLAGQK